MISVLEASASILHPGEVDNFRLQRSKGRFGFWHSFSLSALPTIENLLESWSASYYEGVQSDTSRFPRSITGALEVLEGDGTTHYTWPFSKITRRHGLNNGNKTLQPIDAVEIRNDMDLYEWLQGRVDVNSNRNRPDPVYMRVILHRSSEDVEEEPQPAPRDPRGRRKENTPRPVFEEEEEDPHNIPKGRLMYLPWIRRRNFQWYQSPMLPVKPVTNDPDVIHTKGKKEAKRVGKVTAVSKYQQRKEKRKREAEGKERTSNKRSKAATRTLEVPDSQGEDEDEL